MYCYIHIPFCESRCKYCRFSTFAGKKSREKEIYVDFLINQIKKFDFCYYGEPKFSAWLGIDSESIIHKNTLNYSIKVPELNSVWQLKSIYFWWWTPTSISNESIRKIVDSLKDKFSFDRNIEITLETTPNNITKQAIIDWIDIWINRISIWVQTLNNDSLLEIWRLSRDRLFEKLDILFNSNFKNINLDFIIGLPFVKIWEIKDNIETILNKYSPKWVSLYMLEDYYDYPKTWELNSIKEDDFLWEYISCKDYLEKQWFKRYELSNFAKKRYECSHNKAYWNHSEVLAFWLWSHWFINWNRFSYSTVFDKFYNKELEYIEKLNENDIFLEKLMFWLRTNWLEKYIYEKLDKQKIDELINQKLLFINNEKLCLGDNWVVLLDYILKEIV